MVTFRQLEILFGFTMERNMELKEELQRVGLQSLKRGTLPQGPRLLRSGAQCLDMCTRLLPTPSLQGRHWTINEGELKLLDMGIKPIISRTRMARGSEEIGH
ncbi:unnamed protein product [Microthlaspi erraticum]|uniref:Uncharacterized protein n=1 Tax=Microthlaspi erraticum TaxID=1685480 RepID=A0A6D2HW39_9BRAS|nr:unnamed protein product [Microthlaspi erraticum]